MRGVAFALLACVALRISAETETQKNRDFWSMITVILFGFGIFATCFGL